MGAVSANTRLQRASNAHEGVHGCSLRLRRDGAEQCARQHKGRPLLAGRRGANGGRRAQTRSRRQRTARTAVLADPVTRDSSIPSSAEGARPTERRTLTAPPLPASPPSSTLSVTVTASSCASEARERWAEHRRGWLRGSHLELPKRSLRRALLLPQLLQHQRGFVSCSPVHIAGARPESGGLHRPARGPRSTAKHQLQLQRLGRTCES